MVNTVADEVRELAKEEEEEVTLENGDVFDARGKHIGTIEVFHIIETEKAFQMQVLVDGKFYVYQLVSIEKAEFKE